MANRDFNFWLSGFRDSIADYGYYIDFEKVHRNVDNIKVELNILNSLIGSKNIESDFEGLMGKYPEVLKCIPLLLAVRANEIYCQDGNGGLQIVLRESLAADLLGTDDLRKELEDVIYRKIGKEVSIQYISVEQDSSAMTNLIDVDYIQSVIHADIQIEED